MRKPMLIAGAAGLAIAGLAYGLASTLRIAGPIHGVAASTAKAPSAERWVAAAPGYVEPRNGEIRAFPSMPGRVVSVLVGARAKVQEGELLIRGLTGAAGQQDKRGLLKFQRYDLPLEKGRLVAPQFDVAAEQSERKKLQAMDDAAIVEPLYKLAAEAAKKQVSLEDFRGFVPGA